MWPTARDDSLLAIPRIDAVKVFDTGGLRWPTPTVGAAARRTGFPERITIPQLHRIIVELEMERSRLDQEIGFVRHIRDLQLCLGEEAGAAVAPSVFVKLSERKSEARPERLAVPE